MAFIKPILKAGVHFKHPPFGVCMREPSVTPCRVGSGLDPKCLARAVPRGSRAGLVTAVSECYGGRGVRGEEAAGGDGRGGCWGAWGEGPAGGRDLRHTGAGETCALPAQLLEYRLRSEGDWVPK